ncbi:MAG: DEAD/DEAH box helicase [Campylobacteraceae bacterium]|nr:DEAD/DEAH box helicase [Campylobacteraceae bacterium]
MPEIQNLENYEHIALNLQRLKEFLIYTKEYLVNLGFQIALPKELLTLLRPKPVLKAKAKASNARLSFFNLDSLLEFDYKIAIGDYEIDMDEFEKLILQNGELLRFKENFVLIDPKEAGKLLSASKKQPKLNSFEILAEFLSENLIFDAPTKEQIEKMLEPKKIEVSKNLHAQLRGYQIRGVEWSVNNLLNGFGVVLADDMGLGKTLQTIAVLLYLKEAGHIKNALIVVPTTLLNNWEAELKRFAPTLSYSIYYGTKRELDTSKDLIISTYQLITRDIEKISKLSFDLVAIDEAQNIKNIETKTTKAINSIKSTYKIALSGTPVENNLSELWSIFQFAIPGFLGAHQNFNSKYAKPIESDRDIKASQKLKKITSPFMLRRLKSDKSIISDLPEKIIIDELASMTPAQSALYKATVDDSMRRLEESENTKAEIFRLIIALKQICNHPRNFDKQSALESNLSGKTQLLMTILETILQRDEKVLIFTQYTQMGEILQTLIEKELKTIPLFFHGGLSKTKRDEIIEEFKEKFERKILILSLKAGGVGLNLTQACNVIHYDLWFNPAVETQATDRAFRIGQQKNVTVYRFITKNSFEERIDAMIKSKRELAELSVSSGENWLGEMNKEEIKELFCGSVGRI